MAAFLCRLALYFQLFYYYAFVKNSKQKAEKSQAESSAGRSDEKKNMGPEEAIVTESPTPENPGGPSVSPAPEQEAEQGTIPGMEEKADPSETVIDLAAARKAVTICSVSPERGGSQGTVGSGAGGAPAVKR